MDRITIHELQCYGYHGVFPEENRLGQRFIVNLDIDIDLNQAGQSDDLHATINYAEIALSVKQLVETKSYQLIEALAEAIAQLLLDAFPLIKQIQVHVTKPNPPVALAFAGVTVSVMRKRER